MTDPDSTTSTDSTETAKPRPEWRFSGRRGTPLHLRERIGGAFGPMQQAGSGTPSLRMSADPRGTQAGAVSTQGTPQGASAEGTTDAGADAATTSGATGPVSVPRSSALDFPSLAPPSMTAAVPAAPPLDDAAVGAAPPEAALEAPSLDAPAADLTSLDAPSLEDITFPEPPPVPADAVGAPATSIADVWQDAPAAEAAADPADATSAASNAADAAPDAPVDETPASDTEAVTGSDTSEASDDATDSGSAAGATSHANAAGLLRGRRKGRGRGRKVRSFTRPVAATPAPAHPEQDAVTSVPSSPAASAAASGPAGTPSITGADSPTASEPELPVADTTADVYPPQSTATDDSGTDDAAAASTPVADVEPAAHAAPEGAVDAEPVNASGDAAAASDAADHDDDSNSISRVKRLLARALGGETGTDEATPGTDAPEYDGAHVDAAADGSAGAGAAEQGAAAEAITSESACQEEPAGQDAADADAAAANVDVDEVAAVDAHPVFAIGETDASPGPSTVPAPAAATFTADRGAADLGRLPMLRSVDIPAPDAAPEASQPAEPRERTIELHGSSSAQVEWAPIDQREAELRARAVDADAAADAALTRPLELPPEIARLAAPLEEIVAERQRPAASTPSEARRAIATRRRELDATLGQLAAFASSSAPRTQD